MGDDEVFEEYKLIVAEEVTRLPTETSATSSTKPGRRRRSRDRAGQRAKNASADAAPQAPSEAPRTNLRLKVHEPSDPRPADAIFLYREGLGDVGIEFDPAFCTTQLRSILLGINDRAWDDDYAVSCGDHIVPVGSTLDEQHIAGGSRLRLVRSDDVLSMRQQS